MSQRGIFFLVFWSLLSSVDGRIVVSGVLPHGDFAYDPSLLKGSEKNASIEAYRLHESAIRAGTAFRGEVIVLLTPHGIAAEDVVGVYAGFDANGFAEIGLDLHDPSIPTYKVTLNTSLDSDLGTQIADLSGYTSLTAWGNSEPFPLRWGEVVPLSLMNSSLPVVVLSMPNKRLTKASEMTPRLLELGARLFHLLEASTKEIAVVISADLAHTHSTDGPYGYSAAAQPFDDAIGRFLRNSTNTHLLLDAVQYVDDAKCCGWPGLVILAAILREAGAASSSITSAGGDSLQGQERAPSNLIVTGPFAPTYYGMAVALYDHHAPSKRLK